MLEGKINLTRHSIAKKMLDVHIFSMQEMSVLIMDVVDDTSGFSNSHVAQGRSFFMRGTYPFPGPRCDLTPALCEVDLASQ